jgi:hypothetical protein
MVPGLAGVTPQKRVRSLGAFLYVALVTVLLWLRGHDLGQAAIGAVAVCLVALVVTWVGAAAVARGERHAISKGYLEVAVRSGAAHPRLTRRWVRAQIRPSPGEVRIAPLAGPSAAPFTVRTTALAEIQASYGWRDLLTGPVRSSTRIVESDAPDGAVQIALPAVHVSWLRDAVESGTLRQP